MATKQYLSCADTAKLVRKALKAEFPGTKFSVRSSTYAGGASISVRWTDGPTTKQVDPVLSLYKGATFDGMTDMKSYHDSILVDEDGTPLVVSFGADFIHSSRDVSKQRMAFYRREVERFLGRKPGADDDLSKEISVHDGELAKGSFAYGWLTTESAAHYIGHARPWNGTPCPNTGGAYCNDCGRWQGEHRSPHLH